MRSSYEKGGDHVYQAIKARVIAYEFLQGERIYLDPIAHDLGVSTWPVRQALDRLATEGLVTKAPRKGYYAPTLNEEDVKGHYQITRQVLTLGLETLEPSAVSKLPGCVPIATVLGRLNRRAISEGGTLATYTGEIFSAIAALTGKSAILFAIRLANDHLYFVRTLECIHFDDVRNTLVQFCELLLAGERELLAAAITDYHIQRLKMLPALFDSLSG